MREKSLQQQSSKAEKAGSLMHMTIKAEREREGGKEGGSEECGVRQAPWDF